jgi:lantibiotic modifying enzyme
VLRIPGTAYTGAGHGVSGVLYMLLTAVHQLRLDNKKISEVIRNTIRNMVNEIKANKRLPTIEGKYDEDSDVSFEYGAAGVIPMLIKASFIPWF